jgi:hypothetical protein
MVEKEKEIIYSVTFSEKKKNQKIHPKKVNTV